MSNLSTSIRFFMRTARVRSLFRRTRNSFTLIELLTVISIIAILAGMLLPAINKGRVMAKRSSCMSNIRSLGTGLALYVDSYSEWIPSYRRVWHERLLPMVGNNKKVYLCPGATVNYDSENGFAQLLTLGINASGATSNKAFYGENSSGLYDWKLAQIKAPSSLFYLADCAPYNNVRHPASNVNPGYTNWMDAQGKIHNYNCGMAAGKTHYGLADWHNGISFLFMDGHAETISSKRLYHLMQLDRYGDRRPVRIIPNNNQYYY